LATRKNLIEFWKEKERKKMITVIEYAQLFALIAFAGFMSYTAHEVGNAVHSILHEND
jgi:Flp pilus assembly pilin Flp